MVGTHLASHGYVVAAMDHSEVVAPELAGREDETAAERAARIAAIIAGRVRDVRFLLDHLLDGVRELFGRMPPPKRMFILRDADPQHFVDEAAARHEAVRGMSFPAEAAWLPAAMRPVSELCSPEAAEFPDGDVTGALAGRGVEACAGPWGSGG